MNKATVIAAIAALLVAAPAVAQVSVATQHNDNARTGANLDETTLNTSNVNKDHFGKLAFRLVDGNIYAQPLVVSQAKIATRPAATNVVIVATEHNSVYAFDADDVNPASSTALLWQAGPDVLGAHVESTVLYSDIGAPACTDLTTEFGVTGTPAVRVTKDAAPREGVVFVAAKSKIGAQYTYKVLSLDLASGARLGSISIAGAVAGSGIGSTGGGANAKQRFNPLLELNRPALLLVGNVLYVAFGGHCDAGKYHGWVFAYDVSDPKAIKQLAAFCTTPNGTGSAHDGRGGIWMSGQGPAADDAGFVYFVSGDGTYNGTTDFANSVVKLKLVGGKLQAQDWFTPANQELLKQQDLDLGSGGAMLLPNSHLLIAGGKEGRMFLVDRDNMGKGAAPSLQSFQVTHDATPPHWYNIHGSPVVWDRTSEMFVYVSGEEDPVKQYRLVPDPAPGGHGWKFESTTPFKTSQESAPFPNFPAGMFGRADRDPVWMPGGAMSVSANKGTAGSGILWVSMPYAADANRAVVRGVLRAFDASDVSKGELWNSENSGNDFDRLGQHAKFCPPTIANGKVYVSAFQQEEIGHDGVHRKSATGDSPALVIYGPK